MRCRAADATARGRERGVALPIVLIMLVVVTQLVLTQVRRSSTDERLAANSRGSQLLENAAWTVLQWCEAQVLAEPLRTVTIPAPNVAAWRDPANWGAATTFTFTDVTLPGGVRWNRCLIEDASDELSPPMSSTGQPSEVLVDPRLKKWRLTVQVRVDDPDAPDGFRPFFLQKELRNYL